MRWTGMSNPELCADGIIRAEASMTLAVSLALIQTRLP